MMPQTRLLSTMQLFIHPSDLHVVCFSIIVQNEMFADWACNCAIPCKVIQWFCGVVLKQLTCLYYPEHTIESHKLHLVEMRYILYAPVYRACNAAVTSHSFILSLKVEPGHCDMMP